MNELMLSGLFVGIIAILFVTPYMMSVGIASLEGKVSIGERLLSAIPVLNITRAEKRYYSKPGLVTISIIAFVIMAIARVATWWFMYSNVPVCTASVIGLYLSIVFYFIANMKFVWDVLNDTDAMSGFKKLLFTLAFPIGQYFICSYIATIVKKQLKQEGVFQG